MKKILLAAAIGSIAMTAGIGSADAGHKGKFKWRLHQHIHKIHVYSGCWRYKKLYYKTGHKYWLHKYYDCKY